MLAELPAPKFEIRDRICSKKTGLPAIGKIIGIIHPFTSGAIVSQNSIGIWARHYPDVSNRHIYIVELDNPQRPCNLDEVRISFINKHSAVPPDDLIEQIFDAQPFTNVIAYPEDDLELL